MYRRLLIILISSILFGACVSNKKVQYLQYDDVNVKEINVDSVVRRYQVTANDYKIQINDILSVNFESLTQDEFDFFNKNAIERNQISYNNAGALMSGELVDNNGNIEFPVVGEIKVNGLTIFQAQDTLQTLANQFLKEAVVKVRLLNFRFTILGEVKNEGTVNTYDNRISVLEAVGLAGGIDDLADRANVKMIRQTEAGIQIQYINLLDEELVASPYYYMHQNDVLIVPPLKQRPFRKYAAQNAGLILSAISTILLAINLLK
jgi:polysaccharide export outer membrane protein